MRVVGLTLSGALLIAANTLAAAQAPSAPRPTAQACIDSLTAPTRDSVRLVALLKVHAVGTDAELPGWYQSDYGEAVQRHLEVPRPLGAHVCAASHDTMARAAHLTVRGDYDATIAVDGRVVNVFVRGGARRRLRTSSSARVTTTCSIDIT
jgi:hypothetical protein